jgi:hypothetical protein
MLNIETCYMCDNLATSKEHVPPKCLFPEKKDVGQDKYRQNLITVPSCDIHNTSKSQEDEFLMVSLAGIFGNNSIGYTHKLTKVNRAIKRSSNKLLDKAFRKRKHYVLEKDNNFLEIIWGTLDYDRLINSFTHISYGLHYEYFKNKFRGKIKILLGYLHTTDKNHNNLINFVKHQSTIDLKDIPKFGENEDVFYYQFTKQDSYGTYLLHMRFYGGIDVYASFLPENKPEPYDATIAIVNACDSIILKVEDKEYKIKG